MLSRISFSFELREKKFSWAQGVVACVTDFTIIVTSVTQAKGWSLVNVFVGGDRRKMIPIQ
jgi:hypothetical protein